MDKTEFLTIYPTYGNLEVVRQVLPSIIEETARSDARLIVHDSSEGAEQDKKWAYLRGLAEEHDFFLLLSTNLSMASARNMCLALGQDLYCPDYICMLEDDHGFNPGVIDRLLTAMRQHYGQLAPNGLRYGMFSACVEHTHAQRVDLGDGLSFPGQASSPFDIGGYNSCFRCAPTHHWNNVLKGYDPDDYLISEYQTRNLRWRNYHRGFTVMFVDDGRAVFTIDGEGRGVSSGDALKLWDNDYCASDVRSEYRGKATETNRELRDAGRRKSLPQRLKSALTGTNR